MNERNVAASVRARLLNRVFNMQEQIDMTFDRNAQDTNSK